MKLMNLPPKVVSRPFMWLVNASSIDSEKACSFGVMGASPQEVVEEECHLR
jgi:hypothetical protein